MKTESKAVTRRGSRLLRVGFAGLAAMSAAAGLMTACLDREVSPVSPNTTNIFVTDIRQESVDKIDILFMIDNSSSMADKQTLLQQAVPRLVQRFIDPVCVDVAGNQVGGTASAGCPTGSDPEFDPINDIHIGIVTSSLGGHGGTLCTPAMGTNYNPQMEDNAQLVGVKRDADGTVPDFLAWTGGSQDAAAFINAFEAQVLAAGETGCGYESSLEAWYRFLIDPQPPASVGVDPATGASAPGPVDEVVLAQRAQFLRPDSLVAIIMLTDENDCSVRDDGSAWLVHNTGARLPRSTAACLTNPNDPCCRSCGRAEAAPPDGCQPIAGDPECSKPAFQESEDHPGVRCFNQKQRFGEDFLQPIARYVTGLTARRLPLRIPQQAEDGTPIIDVANPLYAGGRDTSLVFLAGIVGIPWQNIATEATRDAPDDLAYKPFSELTAADWENFIGVPEENVAPKDPFMVESIAPRVGLGPSPYTGQQPAIVKSTDQFVIPNGSEWTVAPTRNDDLQYSCIFQLPVALKRVCDTSLPRTVGCDCRAADNDTDDKPLCRDPGTQVFGETQHFAKAYPGTRFLQVLKGYGDATLVGSEGGNAVIASICPKVTETTNTASNAYGYNAAVAAIVDRLKAALGGTCLPRRLSADADGNVSCQVVEAAPPGTVYQAPGQDPVPYTCSLLPGRDPEPLADDIRDAIFQQLEELQLCGSETGQTPCDQFTLCNVNAVEPGAGRDSCLNTPQGQPVAADGYCYIDTDLGPCVSNDDCNAGTCQLRGDDGAYRDCADGDLGCTCVIGDPQVVSDCPATQRRLLRFVAQNPNQLPLAGTTVLVACQGQPL